MLPLSAQTLPADCSNISSHCASGMSKNACYVPSKARHLSLVRTMNLLHALPSEYRIKSTALFRCLIFPSQNHLAQCQFATVPCPQCQQSVRKSHLEEHTTVECQRRPVSCPDCVARFVYEESEVMRTPLSNCSSCFPPPPTPRILYFGKIVQLHCVSVRISLLTHISGVVAPLASWAAVSLCQREVPVLRDGSHQRPGELDVSVCLEKRPLLNQTVFIVVYC